MPHVRHRDTAIPADKPHQAPALPTTAPLPRERIKHEVLWASVPLNVRGGRLVALRRIIISEVQVGRVQTGRIKVEWVSAQILLTEAQAQRWVALARFTRG